MDTQIKGLIRSAKPEDREAVYSLLCELEEHSLPRAPFEAVYEANLRNPDIYYFVWEQDDRATAFISLHVQLLLHHEAPAAEIQELVVGKESRGGGIGTALWAVAKQTAQERGCALLEVCCNRRRTASHAFYEARGMERSHYKFTYLLN